MSALSTTIEILLKGRDYASEAFESAGSSASGLGDKLSEMSDPFAEIADGALKAESAVLALGGAFVAFSLKGAIEVETAMTELRKVLGDGEDDIDGYKNRVLSISDTFATSVPAVYEAVATWKQANFSISESFDLAEISLKGAKISELSSDETTTSLVRTLSGIDGNVEDTKKLLDLFNFASNTFRADFSEIAEATARSASAFKAGGFDLEETVGVLIQINETVRNGEISGTAALSALSTLGSSTKTVTDALKDMNVVQRDANGAMKGTKEILFELIPKISQLEDAEKAAYLNRLFGREQGSKMLNLFKDEAVAMEKINRLKKESNGSAQTEFVTAMDQTQEKLNGLKVSLENLLAASGDEYLAEFGNVTDATKGLFTVLREEVEAGSFDDLFDVISKNFTNLEQGILKITENLPAALEKVDLKGLAKSFDTLFDSAKDLIGFDLGTEDGLAESIQFVADSIESLNIFVAGIMEGLKPFINALKEGIDEFNKTDEAGKKLGGTIVGFGKGVNSAMEFLGPFLDSLDLIAGAFATLYSSRFIAMLMGTTLTSQVGKVGLALKGLVTTLGSGSFALGGAKLAAAIGGAKAGWDLAKAADEKFPQISAGIAKIAKAALELAGLKRLDKDIFFGNIDPQLLTKLSEKVGTTIKTWDEYQEALKKVKTQTDAIRESNGKIQNSLNDISEKSMAYVERQQKNATANNSFSESAKKANERTKELKEQLVKFTGEAKIEAFKQEEIFKGISGVVEINVDGQIKALENLLVYGDKVKGDAKDAIYTFLNNSQEQTNAINKANIELLTSQRELIDAQTQITRLKSEYGEIRVNADGLKPHLQAVLDELFKSIKMEAMGGNLLTGGQ